MPAVWLWTMKPYTVKVSGGPVPAHRPGKVPGSGSCLPSIVCCLGAKPRRNRCRTAAHVADATPQCSLYQDTTLSLTRWLKPCFVRHGASTDALPEAALSEAALPEAALPEAALHYPAGGPSGHGGGGLTAAGLAALPASHVPLGSCRRAQPKLSRAERQQAEETAIAEWRAAAARPVEQQGHSWGAAAALAAALVQVRAFRVVFLAMVVVA